MTHAIGPEGQPRQAPQPTPRAAGTPRPAVSILSDLSPGRVRLSPTIAPRPARWKWALPPVLLALVGGGFLLGRQAPGPTPAPPLPAAAPASIPSAPPALATVPAVAGGGAIIREPAPLQPGTQAPDATPSPQANVAPPPSRPTPRHHASPARSAAAPQPKPAAAPAGQAVERDVDIITAIVR